jgi:hypothetical protein
MPDNGKPSIIVHVDTACQLLFLKYKKNATQTSRVESTPKKEGGGDKFDRNCPSAHVKKSSRIMPQPAPKSNAILRNEHAKTSPGRPA